MHQTPPDTTRHAPDTTRHHQTISDRLAVVLCWFIELYSWSRFFLPTDGRTDGLTKVIQEVLADLKMKKTSDHFTETKDHHPDIECDDNVMILIITISSVWFGRWLILVWLCRAIDGRVFGPACLYHHGKPITKYKAHIRVRLVFDISRNSDSVELGKHLGTIPSITKATFCSC